VILAGFRICSSDINGWIDGVIVPQHCDARRSGKCSQSIAQDYETLLIELRENAHHQVGAFCYLDLLLYFLWDRFDLHRSAL
jgi:hypothetical protein